MAAATDTPMLWVIEDNADDVELLREAFAESLSSFTIDVSSDAESALERLDDIRRGDATAPDLVLLDLNLPNRPGTDILAAIKSDELLRSVPVVVLSTSRQPEDIRRAYGLHANSYVVKANNFSDFVHDIDSIVRFFLVVAESPADPDGA